MSEPGLHRAWEVWAAENLMRGKAPEVVAARLVEEGLSPTEAARVVGQWERSPVMEAARDLARDAHRWSAHASAHEASARLASRPRSVPREHAPSAERFYDLFVAHRVPVLVGGVVERALALSSWSPEGLAARFGDEEVQVTVGRANDPDYGRTFRRRSESLSLREFVKQIVSEASGPPGDRYLVAMNRVFESTRLHELLAEIHFPESWVDAGALEAGGASLWLGPGGTQTPLHRDQISLLVCQLYGRKRWRLIPPTERALLARVQANQTLLDADDIEGALVKEVTVEAGEALFVPAGWWHQVEALGVSCTLSIEALRGRTAG